jgi:hypothetical protein
MFERLGSVQTTTVIHSITNTPSKSCVEMFIFWPSPAWTYFILTKSHVHVDIFIFWPIRLANRIDLQLHGLIQWVFRQYSHMLGGVNHCHSHCHSVKFHVTIDDINGQIRPCDWLTNLHFRTRPVFDVLGYGYWVSKFPSHCDIVL